MIKNQAQKIEVFHLFKGGPGTYGNGEKQTTEDDFIQLKSTGHIPKLPYTTSLSIYHRKSKAKFNYDQTLNLLFVLCVIILIVLKFFIDDIFITVHAKNSEDLISKLCFAFIGSYIFYNVVTKTTDKLKKQEAYAVVCGLIHSIVDQGNNVKKWLLVGAGKNKQIDLETISKEDFKTFCSEINIDIIPDGKQITIGNLLILHGVTKINFFTEKVFTYMPFLETKLTHKLTQIQNSKFSIYIIVIPFKQHPNLREFSLEILEFLEFIKELEKYNDKLKKKYLKDKYERRVL